MMEALVECGADVNFKDSTGKTALCTSAEKGQLEGVQILLKNGADINFKDTNGKSALDLASTTQVQNALKLEYMVLKEKNIVGEHRVPIIQAVQKTLSEAPRPPGKFAAKRKDLQCGEFKDSANGILSHLKVLDHWDQAEACTLEGMKEEIRRLTDCPDCSKLHAKVLLEIKRGAEAGMHTRLASALSELLEARRNTGLKKSDIKPFEDKVAFIRQELEDIDGWYYGRLSAKPVEWPADQVKHAWGTYGQPLCDKCKKYCLDFSTVSTDFRYVTEEVSSEREYFNGVRDKGRGGLRLDDFMKMREATETKLTKAMVAALRFYTSHSFTAINQSLRDRTRDTPHPLPGVTINIENGLKLMRALDARDETATQETIFYRGFTDMKVAEEFMKRGGAEFAPMSTTKSPTVAAGYAVRKGETDGSLIMRIRTSNNLERGAALTWLSLFPDEDETLFPPLTFMQPTGRIQVIEVDGIKLTVVEVRVTIP